MWSAATRRRFQSGNPLPHSKAPRQAMRNDWHAFAG